jgi:hypothetical protein
MDYSNRSKITTTLQDDNKNHPVQDRIHKQFDHNSFRGRSTVAIATTAGERALRAPMSPGRLVYRGI